MNQLAELRLSMANNPDLDMLKTAFSPMRFQAANTSQDDLHGPWLKHLG